MIKLGKSLEEIYDELNEKVMACFLIRKSLIKIYQRQKLDDCKKMLINVCKEVFQEKLKSKLVYFAFFTKKFCIFF